MNGQFQVAQASGTGNSGNSTPPRIFKLTKPLTDQAVVVNLGYDQKVQVDFSSIANEKITLVHVGEKLIILFDNQSTVTVEPFFDSRHDGLQNLTIEVAPGRDLSVSEFASAFPITTDQSVLPAAGTGNGNAQASGGDFNPSVVDPLPPIPTNVLAPPEVLPNLQFINPTGVLLTTPTTPAVGPTIAVNGTLALTLSEMDLTATTNNGISGSTPNLPLTSTSGNFGSYFTDTPGSAAITSVVYALSIVGGNGTASGLVDSQTGLKDVLVLNTVTGAIEGHVGSAGGALAFTIAVNPTTGIVTFTEDRAVDQTQVSNTSLSENIASLTAGVVQLTQTVTDTNNNTASASLDLGPHLSITDDGPIVTVVAASEPALTLSETHLTATADDNNIAGTAPNLSQTSVTGNFSGAFTDVSGADGTKSTAYTLSINGTASGLVDSHTGTADVLVQTSATTITGYVGSQASGLVAFTISVDPATGIVTFTEDRAVVQAQSGSDPSATPALFTTGVVELTQTVTDNDGTVASASLDLGAKLSITDDGPIVTVVAASEPALTLSETHLTATADDNNIAGTAPNLSQTSVTGNFSGAFTDVSGADGTKSTAYTLSINGTASGLVDSHTGTADVLVQTSATTITGYVGSQASGLVAFTISVDPATGIVTFTEDRAVVQAQSGSDPSATPALFTTGVVELTQTVTDNDGTVASASLDLGAKLSITDDGPIVTVVAASEPALTLSETHLTATADDNNIAGTAPNLSQTSVTGNFSGAFTDVSGADGTKSTAYTLSINGTASGLVDSHTGTADVLVQTSATTITGYVGSQASGLVAFTISVDPATGIVTFTEDRAVVQAQSGSDPSATPALFTTGVVELTQTVTDNDGTVASASLDLGAKLSITDDGPIVTVVAASEPALTLSETHLTATADDNNIAGTAPNLSQTSVTGNFSGAFTDVSGADGTKSTAYTLSINGTASGLVDSHTGTADVLVQTSATTITGYVGSQASGLVAFTISVDPATGIVTFTEDRAVVQAQSGSDPSATPALFTTGVVELTQTVTDNDGTVASASLDLGAKLSITDDGPIVTVVAASEPALTLSETHLTATADDNNIAGTAPNLSQTSVTGNFSGAFTDVSGADGTKSTAYTLSINGTASGLVDSHTGTADVLVQTSATTITGYVGSQASGLVAFTISVDPATGIVTFTEDRAVVQAQSGSDPSATPALFTTGVVELTQTVTDNDGTVASASLDLGAKLSITDDGPIVTVVAASEPALTLSETHLTATADDNNIAGTAPNLSQTSVTGNFSGAFTDVSGADGTKSTAYTLSINGTASGLVDSHTGTADVLVQTSATTITGYVGSQASGLVAFTISVDPATGIVTFTEDRAVVQAQSGSDPSATPALFTTGVVELTQTVTDNDGTVASASLDLGAKLSITDDGPIVTVVAASEPALTLSETHLTATADDNNIAGTAPNLSQTSVTGNFSGAFTDVSGADGTKSTAYTLSINGTASGLVDSHTGTADVLVQTSATTITGYVGSQASGLVAFTISVDPATGIVTFTEDRAVVQAQSGSDPSATPALFTTGVVELTQTVTDNDGTVASASLDLGAKLSITDDGPIVTVVAASEPALTLSETHLTATADDNNIAGTAPNLSQTSVTGNFSGAFTDVSGADGTKSTAYTLSINGTASGLVDSHTGTADVLVQTSATTITGYVGSQASGLVAFTISVDPATGIVTFTEDRAVVQAQSGSDPSATPALFTTGVVELTQTVTDNDGTVASASLDLGAKLSITDDGPIVTVVAASEPALTLSETHLTATADDNNIAGTAPNLSQTSVTGNFSGAFTDVSGADGTKSTAYTLSINGTASGLVDSHTGTADVLVQTSATTITGYVGSQASGLVAFTISVDPATGIVTFTEDRAVVQAQSGSDPSATPALFTTGVVELTQTVTDNDGTVASASLDLGAKLSITDDGPIVTVVAASEPALTLSETHLTATADDNNIAGTAPNLSQTSVTGNFSGAFTDVSGADGTKSTAYTLSINGTASGLVDSHTGTADVLVQTSATTITGYVGSQASGLVAFTISVDPATGIVTFTEDRAVVQAQSGSDPSATPALFTTGVVELTQTVTDNDGTVASASLDLGAKLSITDDGPIVTVVAASEPALTLSETHLTATADDNNIAGTAPNLSQTSVTGNFSGAFTDVSGADGTKSTAYTLSINGTASGLVDSHTGTADVLVQTSATTITGYVGSQASGLVAFTISVDPATGIVTFTEDRAVVQAQSGSDPSATPALFTTGVVELTQTVTDNDGTVASASLDLGAKLSITDDGPIVTVVAASEPALTLSETHLTATADDNNIAGTAPNLSQTSVTGNFSGAFTDVSGADGTKSTAYTLSINGTASGLVDSHTGTADVLVQTSATTITGYVGSQASGLVAFTISVDPATGIVTFTEDRAVVQAQSGSDPSATPALFTTGVVELTQTVTDNDGTVASASLDLGAKLSITDDGPIITAVQDAVMPSVDLTDVQGTWQPTFGADGPASAAAIGIAIPSGTIGGTTYTVTDTHTTNAAGDEVFQVGVSGSPGYTFYEYTHYTAGTQTAEMFAYTTEADAQAGLANNEFFTLSMDANGTYDFHLVTNSLQTQEVFNLTTQKSGEGEFFEINGTTGAFGSGTIPTTGFDLLIDGWNSSSTSPTNHTIHGNANGFGVDNGNLDTNETIAFIAGHDQSGMTVGIGKGGNATNETVQITIWNDAHSQSATETVTQLDGTAVKIDAADWTGTGANAFFNFKEADITNLGGTAGFPSSDDKLDLTSVTFNTSTTVGSTVLNFTPTITDGDGSSATGTNLSVALDGTPNSNGGYTLVGGTESDVILSSSHVDTMTGGGGNDTFEFNNPLDGGGQGSTVTIAGLNTDTITDFNLANDTIAVSAAGFGGGLLAGVALTSTQVFNNAPAAGNVFDNSGNQRFVFDEANHTLYYSATGQTGAEHAIAILNGVASINATNIHVVH